MSTPQDRQSPEWPNKNPANPPTPPSTPTWHPGTRRILVEAICCESCGSHHLHRINVYGRIAYWQCETCHHRQKDDLKVGGDRAHLA